jgi:hypothetical protein
VQTDHEIHLTLIHHLRQQARVKTL